MAAKARSGLAIVLALFLSITLSALPARATGVWTPASLDGIGPTTNTQASSMVVFNGELYVGTKNNTLGGGVFKYNGTSWSQVGANGLGDTTNKDVTALVVFDGKLYAGVTNNDGGEVYQWDGANWNDLNVNFPWGTAAKDMVGGLASSGTYLFAGSSTTSDTNAAVIYRYDGAAWTNVTPPGLTLSRITALAAASDGTVYAGPTDTTGPVSIFKSTDHGGTWITMGGTPWPGTTKAITTMVLSGGVLSVGTYDPGGNAGVYQYNGGWSTICTPGFGLGLQKISSLANGSLYMGFGAGAGSAVFRYDGGTGWTALNTGGFWSGVDNVHASSMAVYNGKLYVGTQNSTGCEVWSYGPSYTVNLPAGSTAAEYKILSVPVDVGADKTATTVLGLSGYDTTQIRLGNWDPATTAYAEYPAMTSMDPGRAFWGLARGGQGFTFTGDCPAGSPYAFIIQNGWNQVGNPYSFPILMSGAKVWDAANGEKVLYNAGNNITQQNFWVFSGGVYYDVAADRSGKLYPAQGGWIKKITAGSGEIRFIAAPFGWVPTSTAQDLAADVAGTSSAVPDAVERPPDPPGGVSSNGQMSSGGGGGGGGGCFIAGTFEE